MIVQLVQRPHKGAEYRAWQLSKGVHAGGGIIGFITPAEKDLLHYVVMQTRHGGIFAAADKGESLFAVVGEGFFDDESGGDLVAQIYPFVFDKPVQLWPYKNRFHQGGEHDMKYGVRILRTV